MALHVDTQVTTVDYPDTDGLPMAESDFQRKPLTYAVEVLDIYFQDRPDVSVSGNLFLYYREGDPRAVVAPDVFVVFGAAKRDRPSYKLWEEPKAPDFVLEITSKSTRSEDQESKPQTYAQLGVREYVQYDPTGDYLTPPLQGLRLVGGTYEPLPVTEQPEGRLVLYSAVLALELHVEGNQLHFYTVETGQKLLTHRKPSRAAYKPNRAVYKLSMPVCKPSKIAFKPSKPVSKPNRHACKLRSASVGKLPCARPQKRVLLNRKHNSVPCRHAAPQKTRSARDSP
jgi:Uma2 family endonuclease